MLSYFYLIRDNAIEYPQMELGHWKIYLKYKFFQIE